MEAGEQVAVVGIDQPGAEVFISLVTGASLPESGAVRVFGRDTSAIRDSDEWLATLDRFGIVSARAALLDALTVTQNLALPFSLDIDPPSDDLTHQAEELAREVGLPAGVWKAPAGALTGALRVRARLARALALGPSVLLLEHPSAAVDRADVSALGRDVRRIVAQRGATAISITMDRTFADAAAARTLTLDPATGRSKEGRFGRMGFWS